MEATRHTPTFPAKLHGMHNGVIQVEGSHEIIGGLDGPLAIEAARRWNAHADLLAFVERVAATRDDAESIAFPLKVGFRMLAHEAATLLGGVK